MTFKGQYRFIVEKWSDGSPWLVAEPSGDVIPGMGDLGFNLEPGTTFEQAHALADAMNRQISAVLIQRRFQGSPPEPAPIASL